MILHPDGSIYHLKLRQEDIADTVIIVGDQGRVSAVSRYFDEIDTKIQNREFVTHTGRIGKRRLSVMSTGIGTDNIDIAMNELDALVNIDLETRLIKDKKQSLNIIRIGTSGSLQEDIPVDSFLLSTYGIGFDGLLNFYSLNGKIIEHDLTHAFIKHSGWSEALSKPYIVKGDPDLIELFKDKMYQGITATASGFYAPQGRQLRLSPLMPDMNEILSSFKVEEKRITNFEMETAALYGLGKALGHRCCTVCAIIANRFTKRYSKDYKKTVDGLIKIVLEKLS